jgi:ubiquinone/menaquinone biosynthesis C-methylase UbiE
LNLSMGRKFDILAYYPQSGGRADLRPVITDEQREISRRFGFDYFDGDRQYGYGGYSYNARFWTETVKHIADYYQLAEDASILDVGCGKGFMLKDFQRLMPGAELAGIDISAYALEHAAPEVAPLLTKGCATQLPYGDDSFDLVVSINTVHNLDRAGCVRALREIQRVAKRHACVVVDGWESEQQRREMLAWVLTAQTLLPVSEWLELFREASYEGDYAFWTVS